MGDDRFDRLTERQRACLRLIYARHDAKSIARMLGITPEGVNYHLKESRRILGVDRSLAAARLLAESEGQAAYQSLIVDPMIVELPAVSGNPHEADQVGDGTGGSDDHVLNEPAVAYRPPVSYRPSDYSADPSFPWPFPTHRRRQNDLKPATRILLVLGCATLILALALVLLIMSHSAQQILTQTILDQR